MTRQGESGHLLPPERLAGRRVDADHEQLAVVRDNADYDLANRSGLTESGSTRPGSKRHVRWRMLGMRKPVAGPGFTAIDPSR